jgi:hypothetical protein
VKLLPLIVLVLLGLFSRPAHAGAIQLPRTGQTLPYAAGDDGTLQKGVAATGPRFTDNADGTVTDNLTGLVWLRNARCNFGDSVSPVFNLSWSDALGVSNALASGRCGLSDGSKAGDWRLPNVVELESLVDIAQAGPALPVAHPFSGVQSNVYWSSTTNARNSGSAWTVNFDSGLLLDFNKALSYSVWAVRNVRYHLNSSIAGAGGGTVTSNPAGISCTGSCSALFDAATQVVLIPTPSIDSYFAGWSGGGCSESGNCLVTMNSDLSLTATFGVHLPVKLGTAYHSLIDDAYATAADGDDINIRAVDLTESPVFSRPAHVTLTGGFDGTFTGTSGFTTVHGSLKISAGSVAVRNIVIR